MGTYTQRDYKKENKVVANKEGVFSLWQVALLVSDIGGLLPLLLVGL